MTRLADLVLASAMSRVIEGDTEEDLFEAIEASAYKRSPYYRHALLDRSLKPAMLPEDETINEIRACSLGMGSKYLPSLRRS